jgi:Tol biopolymer transport system component
MQLPAGSSLGPYEILGLIGAGGMGEVYRARDARLGRDVAVKVLPAAFAADRERLRRFEQEARSAGRINHPNILAIYDVGTHEGQPYLVTEYLAGQTLRERIEDGALPARKAVELAIAFAYGLAAAHEQGIVHRDLKPENLIITPDGRLKILDFGLAKLTRPDEEGSGHTGATAPADTGPGTVWGTVGYMSPEQVRGHAVDHRSDIFSFGAILYEMVSGRRAFKGDSPADTMSAILREDPTDITLVDREIPIALERIVRHCLEKAPGERFRSAHDLAFQLESLSTLSGTGAAVAAEAGPAPAPREITHYTQLTHSRGPIWSARFAPDGETVLYTAEWSGGESQLYMKRPESPDAIPLASSGIVAGVSRTGEMALLLDHRFVHNGVWAGTLALAPMFGGAPRLVAEDIQGVDFSADGRQMLVSRDVDGKGRIEFPLGTLLYESRGHVSWTRLSPRGDRIAFFEHPFPGDDRGVVAVIDLSGSHRVLTEEWTSAQGLAWTPDGTEIWFTVATSGSTRALYGVTPEGSQRFISGFPGTVRLHDIAPSGHLILTRDSVRVGVSGKAAGETRERELSWLDWSLIGDISADGQTVLFDEENEQIGRDYLVCMRRMDGSPVVRLGAGRASSFSPDGKWAVSQIPTTDAPLMLLPTGPGQPRRIDPEGIRFQSATRWFPDGRRLLVLGRPPEGAPCFYVIDVETGAKTVVEPGAGVRPRSAFALSDDGESVAFAIEPEGARILSLAGGSSRPVQGLGPREELIAFSADGRHLFVIEHLPPPPATIHRIDLESGTREPWKTLAPEDVGGVLAIFGVRLSRDGEAYAYSYSRILSELFLVRGLR